jgi:hypothetical protein
MAQIRTRREGPLQAALQESTDAAATRATAGQKVFSPIAAFLDKHRAQSSSLAPHLQRALALLSNDLAAVAQRHFNAFISGIDVSEVCSPPALAVYKPPSPPASRPPSSLDQPTYAAAACLAASSKPC